MRGRRYQSGQMLIGEIFGILLALGALGVFLVLSAYSSETSQTSAQGAMLSQMGIGLRGFTAQVQGGQITLPTNPYTVTGVNWLKPPSCGGLPTNPTQGFVPCSYTGGRFGPIYSTTITQTLATNTIDARTWYVVPPATDGPKSAIRMAAEVVDAALAQQSAPMNGMFYNAFSNSPVTATSQVTTAAIAAADDGRVLFVVDNSPSNDIWLRVDGTNEMLANLNNGGNSIVNTDNITYTGNLSGNTANFTGTVTGTNESLTGSLGVQGTGEFNNGLTVMGSPADLRAGAITTDTAITSIGEMASQGIYNGQVLAGSSSYSVTKPNCASADVTGSTAEIFAAMQGTGTPNGGDATYEAHVQVVDNGTFWTVTPEEQNTTFTLGSTSTTNGDGSITTTITLNKSLSAENPTNQTILVMTKCR